MAQKREKEATTELKLRPPSIQVPFPATRPSETLDPKLSDNIDNQTDSSTNSPDKKTDFAPTSDGSKTTSLKRPREVCRCSGSGCRKRVGLMGFRCRCGDVFCSEHRYSDRHDCGYDYKAAGRETIARENPVVKAAKLVKV